MSVQIGAKPDSGFDDPIGMLKDCHRRIERFIHILEVVARRAQGRALTVEETEAVQAALQYFHVGGKRHNADEEESLFPRLRAKDGAGHEEALERLENDHRNALNLHAAVETFFTAWMSAGRLSPEGAGRLVSATEQLEQLYKAHIQVEEEVVFPHAAEALDTGTIAAIGMEFRARRA
ncbi:MAG TPA: hemerythrin domain-containing protein [Terracidiphilus sp.]|nr:hemerythrin domain-containing protein [Terracidiphilus sp.]